MPVTFDIVEATADDDFAEVGALGVSLVRFHHALDPRRFTLCDGAEQKYAETLREAIEKFDTAIVLIARDARDQSVLGYVYGELQDRDFEGRRGASGHLHELYVDDAARHRGVGKALVAAFLARTQAAGSRRVVLMVASSNIAAHDLFSASGFQPSMIEMVCEFGLSG